MRAIRNAVNPFSTAFSRWWCHSSLRAISPGRPRDFYRRRRPPHAQVPVLDPAVRQTRIDAIERSLGPDRG